jgi:hypothetical protein
LAGIDAFITLRIGGITKQQAEEAIRVQPKRLLCMEWAPAAHGRDLTSPHLWVFLLHEAQGALLFPARGWPDLSLAARQLICHTYPEYFSRKRREARDFRVPEQYIQTARPHLHVFNITAVLAKLDRMIIEKLKRG